MKNVKDETSEIIENYRYPTDEYRKSRSILFFSVIIVIGLIMTGCAMSKNVNSPEVKDFKKDIIERYDYIVFTKVYRMSGPNTLFIEHISNKEIDFELAKKCFKATKEWVTQPSNLEAIENKIGNKVSKISIEISSQTRYDNWEASYYSCKPNESLINKTQIDYFETWEYWETVKEETTNP